MLPFPIRDDVLLVIGTVGHLLLGENIQNERKENQFDIVTDMEWRYVDFSGIAILVLFII